MTIWLQPWLVSGQGFPAVPKEFHNDSDLAAIGAHDIEIIQRELPIDLLEPHCLTALPGSEDRQKLHKTGAWRDPDLNKYDLEHVTTLHQQMSTPEWEKLYLDAWEAFYSLDHIETVLRRAAATRSSPRKMTSPEGSPVPGKALGWGKSQVFYSY
jgi:hypothetical protein